MTKRRVDSLFLETRPGHEYRPATRWPTTLSLPPASAWYVTKFASHKALTLIASDKLTLDERVVVHRVVTGSRMPPKRGR